MLPSQHYSDGEDETDQIAEERREDGLSDGISSDDEAVQLELHARIKLKGECRTVKRLMSLEFSSTTILAWFKLSYSFSFAFTSQSADHLFPCFASRMAHFSLKERGIFPNAATGNQTYVSRVANHRETRMLYRLSYLNRGKVHPYLTVSHLIKFFVTLE